MNTWSWCLELRRYTASAAAARAQAMAAPTLKKAVSGNSSSEVTAAYSGAALIKRSDTQRGATCAVPRASGRNQRFRASETYQIERQAAAPTGCSHGLA